MIIGMENGKTNLSIKRTIAPPPRKEYVPRQRTNGSAPASGYGKPANRSGSASNRSDAAQPAAQTKSFDDMLKKFMSESDSKMSSIRAYSDRKTKTRRR